MARPTQRPASRQHRPRHKLVPRSSRRGDLTPRQEEAKNTWNGRLAEIRARVLISPEAGGSPYDYAKNVLERELYRLICSRIDISGGLDMIQSAVLVNCHSDPRKVTLSGDPFFWGLKAAEVPLALRRDQVSRLAKIMMYAWRHKIEPDLFTGFVMQTGRARITQATRSAVEPWFSCKPTVAD